MSEERRPVAQLIEQLIHLPGIGRRSAERIAFHLLKGSMEEARALTEAIVAVKERLSACQRCYNLAEGELCAICRNGRREAGIICVVQEPRDVLAIEKSGCFRGLYHVLWGVLAPLDGIGPEQLKIQPLLQRVTTERPTEIILATNPDQNGEATALYLKRLLQEFPVTVTRIAYGVPVGGHLEFADQATLAKALQGRQPMEE